MASVREIAQASGVSITTVSRVLNNSSQVAQETRDRVLEATKRVGYVHTIGRRNTSSIALAYTALMDQQIGSPFDAPLMRGIAAALSEFGFDLMVLDLTRAREPGERFAQMFLRKGIRGVILRTTQGSRHIAEEIASEEFPAVVVADRFETQNDISFVEGDSRASSREAIDYLIGLGHERIAIVIFSEEIADMRDRLAAYTAAHEAAGLEVDPRLIIRVPFPLGRDIGSVVMRRVLTLPEMPTALFLTDSHTSIHVLSEAYRLGVRVPDDLSIVGFDDSEARLGTAPQMSAVCQDASATGRAAVAALRRLLDSRPKLDVVHEVLPTWFEARESTGPARRAADRVLEAAPGAVALGGVSPLRSREVIP